MTMSPKEEQLFNTGAFCGFLLCVVLSLVVAAFVGILAMSDTDPCSLRQYKVAECYAETSNQEILDLFHQAQDDEVLTTGEFVTIEKAYQDYLLEDLKWACEP
jgi:hypothetical protein